MLAVRCDFNVTLVNRLIVEYTRWSRRDGFTVVGCRRQQAPSSQFRPESRGLTAFDPALMDQRDRLVDEYLPGQPTEGRLSPQYGISLRAGSRLREVPRYET